MRSLPSLCVVLLMGVSCARTPPPRPYSPVKGNRVRISSAAHGLDGLEANLERMTADSLVVSGRGSGAETAGGLASWALASLDEVSVCTHKTPRTRRGALIGAGVGAVVAIIGANSTRDEGSSDGFGPSDEAMNGIWAVSGISGGALLGALVGSQMRECAWQQIHPRMPTGRSPAEAEPGSSESIPSRGE
jgi:hypothetical protein